MIRALDKFLNSITMYKLVLYGMLVLAVTTLILSVVGLLSYTPLQLALSFIGLTSVCYFTNEVASRLLKAPVNSESYVITALILFFILTPPATSEDVLYVLLAGALAMLSKYVFAVGRKHLFNPAAISAVILGALGIGIVSWWVATPALFPFTLALSLLVIRKLRKFTMVGLFLVTALLSINFFIYGFSTSFWQFITEVFASWPLVFFAGVMLTEPMTMPTMQRFRIVYAVFVGLLFGITFHIGPVYSTPELALVAGNLFAFLVNPSYKLMLRLKAKIQLSPTIYEFVYEPSQQIDFQPGQYMEWTLPHEDPDTRGNRRYFTIASSPTEPDVKLGVRFCPDGSSFKHTLAESAVGSELTATQLAGDFVLPSDVTEKLVFIAGGIGVTPFRSMIKYLLDRKEKRDITMFYCSNQPEDFVYKDIFDQAAKELGIKTVYVVSDISSAAGWQGPTGLVTAQLVESEVPDYAERTCYLSGPEMMVRTYKELLHDMGIGHGQIVTDYFPGF